MKIQPLPDMPPLVATLAAEILQLGFYVRWDAEYDPQHLNVMVDHYTRPGHEVYFKNDKVTVTANDGCGHEIPTDFDLCDPEFLQQLRAYFVGQYYTPR